MHEQVEPGNFGRDEDVASFLHEGTQESVDRAIRLMHERHGFRVWRGIRKRFPGLLNADVSEIYEAGVATLATYALDGRFKARKSRTGALALLKRIVTFDALDRVRRESRRGDVYRIYLARFPKVRVDNPRKLQELMIAINEYIDTKLEGLEKVALYKYMELLCDSDEAETDDALECLLPREVNIVLGPPQLTDDDIRLAFVSARKKLREYLVTGEFFQ